VSFVIPLYSSNKGVIDNSVPFLIAECDKYGQQFLPPIPENLAGHDDAYFYDITVDECRDMCIAETRFVCRAI